MENNFSNRNTSIEFLRLWFMLLIVLIHAYCHGSGLNYEYLYSLGSEWSTAHHLGLLCIGKCGVTGFMFISGYYGVSLKWNKLASMIAMLLFYVLLLTCFGGYSVSDMLKIIFHPWDEWWFVSSYMVICFLSPLLNQGISALGKRQFGITIIGLLFYEYVGKFISQMNSHDTMFLLTIYLCARYIRLYIAPPIYQRLTLKHLGLVSLSLGVILFFFPILFAMLGLSKLNPYFISNNNILLLIFTSTLVLLLDKIKYVNRIINYFAASTLAIYILTDNAFVRIPLDTWLFDGIMNGGIGYVYVFVAALVCLLIDKIRELLFSIIIKLYNGIKTK